MWGSHSQLESALKEKHLSRVRGPDDPAANRGGLQQKALPRAGLDWNSAPRSFAIFQRVPKRDAKTLHSRSAELKVVAHEVKMRFRPDKDTVRHVETQSSAHVRQKVVAALEIGAPGETARKKRLVKPEALNPDPALQFRLRPFAHGRSKHGVEIVQNRPVWVEKNIYVLMATPGDFSSDSEVFFNKEEIAAERGITAPADALRSVVRTRKPVRGGLPRNRTHAESQIKLLCVCSAGTQ